MNTWQPLPGPLLIQVLSKCAQPFAIAVTTPSMLTPLVLLVAILHKRSAFVHWVKLIWTRHVDSRKSSCKISIKTNVIGPIPTSPHPPSIPVSVTTIGAGLSAKLVVFPTVVLTFGMQKSRAKHVIPVLRSKAQTNPLSPTHHVHVVNVIPNTTVVIPVAVVLQSLILNQDCLLVTQLVSVTLPPLI